MDDQLPEDRFSYESARERNTVDLSTPGYCPNMTYDTGARDDLPVDRFSYESVRAQGIVELQPLGFWSNSTYDTGGPDEPIVVIAPVLSSSQTIH